MEFQSNLQWYLDQLDYAEDWTWFDAEGNALSDEEVAAMTTADKAAAFVEGRYAKSSTKGMGGMRGGMGGMNGTPPDGALPKGELPDGELPQRGNGNRGFANEGVAENSAGDTMEVGTPDAGTTQANGSSVDSAYYTSYEEMVQAYAADLAEIEAGDTYGNNIVDLYNPLNDIDAEGTENPTWVRI